MVKTKQIYKKTKNPYKIVEVFNTNGEDIKDTLEKIYIIYTKEKINNKI